MQFPRLFTRKQCYLPTTTGCACILCISITLSILVIAFIHPFLAPCRPVCGEALIVEGWLPDCCLETVARYFGNNQYQKIFVTGGPLESGSYLKEYKTYASLGAATLRALSIPDSCIIAVPAPSTVTDRTYTSAVALGKWVDSANSSLKTFDLVSLAAHTRRSALLFRRALGKEYRIGSIAVPHPDYNPECWWRSSTGVRSVMDETIAYLYALFFLTFH